MESLPEQCEIRACQESGRAFGLWNGLPGVLVALGLFLAGRPASASAIKAMPAPPPLVIDQPGHYSVVRDLVSSGSAITITANNVLLALHGHTISGPESGSPTTGISVQNASGVTIEDGIITGFGIGLGLFSAVGSTVSGNSLTGNAVGTVLDGNSSNNTVDGNTATGNAGRGILLDRSSNTLPGNTATSNTVDGIESDFASSNTLIGNEASDTGASGILCALALPHPSHGTTMGRSARKVQLNVWCR